MAIHHTAGIPTPARTLAFGEARWDRISRQLKVRSETVKLNWRMTEALSVLVEAKGAVVPKEDLQRQVWGDVQMDDSVVPQCIGTIRRAIDPAPGGASYIETVSRVGYRLAVEVVEESETASPVAPPNRPSRRRALWWAGAGGVAVACAGVGAAAIYRMLDRQGQAEALVERGYRLLRNGNIPDGKRANDLFRDSLALVPDYPPANAGLAEAMARLGEFTFESAAELARRAVDQDPGCAECQSTLGYVLGVRMWKWTEAGEHLARSVELNPLNASHRILFAEWLMVQGRLADASREAEEARRLDPREARAWSMLAAVRFFQKRYADSIREAGQAASLAPNHPNAYVWMCRSHLQMGDDVNAISARVKEIAARENDGGQTFRQLAPKYFALLETSGRKAVAKAWLEDVGHGRPKEINRYYRAVWMMWVGDADAALAELEAGAKSRPYQMIYAAVDPAFEPLRANPRFQNVVRAVGLKI